MKPAPTAHPRPARAQWPETARPLRWRASDTGSDVPEYGRSATRGPLANPPAHTMTAPAAIQLTRTLPHPPAKVWAALTDPAIHAQWWAAGDVRPVVGHRFTLDMGRWGMQPCEVLVAEDARRLAYAFAPGVLNTVITWTLVPEGDGTRLSLEHAGFDPDSPMGKTAFEGMRAGWPMVIDRLAAVLAA